MYKSSKSLFACLLRIVAVSRWTRVFALELWRFRPRVTSLECATKYNPKPLSSYLKRQIQATKQGLPNRGGFVQYDLPAERQRGPCVEGGR